MKHLETEDDANFEQNVNGEAEQHKGAEPVTDEIGSHLRAKQTVGLSVEEQAQKG